MVRATLYIGVAQPAAVKVQHPKWLKGCYNLTAVGPQGGQFALPPAAPTLETALRSGMDGNLLT